MIRVLVAEDSPTARRLLVEMLTSDPEITVIGEAVNGLQAVEMAERLRPDLITMDVQMPELDGLEATMRIVGKIPTPIIIVSSQANASEVELSLEATRAGALMVLPKPEGPLSPKFREQQEQLVAMVKAMSDVKVVRRWGASTPAKPHRAITAQSPVRSVERPGLLAIGASTGGPAALRDVLSAMPPGFGVPILVVQHISRGFVNGLANWLGANTRLQVRVATASEPARPGVVYLAPDDSHLGIRDDGRIALSNAPAIGSFRPSATHLFQSAAAAFGGRTIAVILTGMGDDGVAGLRAVHAAGGLVIAQDESTSVVYGMPREAARAGVVSVVLPLPEIASRLVEVVS
jgi:two-component system chemotaxis response regulator CheB